MAGAAQDPLALLQALLQDEDRPNARESLHGIINNWQNLLDRMDNYTVEDVLSSHDSEECMELISGIRRDLETMQARMNRAATEMPQLMDDDVSGGERLLNIKAIIRTNVRDYMNRLREKLNNLKTQAEGAGAGRGPAGGALLGGGAAPFQIYQDPPVNVNQNTVLARTRARSNAVLTDGRLLLSDMQEIDIYMWEAAQDSDINKAMRKIKVWKDDLAKVVKAWREIDEMMIVSNIPERDRPGEAVEAKELVDDLQKVFKDTKTEIEAEDLRRGLHSLDVSSSAKVNYPTFEGKDEEDWEDFKVKFEKALADNKVRTSDKCDKLRSSLRGYARKLVPNSQTNYQAAIEALEKAFGDSTRFLQNKIKALNDLGSLPKSNEKKGKSVVEWYLNLEVILTSVRDIGVKTEDDDIKATAFSKEIIKTVATLFPQFPMGNQILDCKGTGERRLNNVIEQVAGFRERAQQWVLAQTGSSGATGSGTGCTPNGGHRNSQSSHNNQRGNLSKSSFITHNPPVRMPDCRVCKILEDSGDTRQLYDNHHSNYPTGCPRFISMSVEQRRDTAIKAKFCLKCLDPKYKFAGRGDARHKCFDFSKRKTRYTCPRGDCRSHLWTCTRHRDENTAEFERFRTEIENKTGLQFCYFIGMLPFPISEPQTEPQTESLPSPSLTPPPGENSSSSEGESVTIPTFSPSLSAKSSPEPQRLSSNEAFTLLERKMKGKKIRAKFRPIEKGAPQFMLGYSKGKTRPLVTLYDTGCMNILFKEGVPNSELGPSVVMMKGPLYVNGVGDTSVRVNAEYMCSMELVDGTRAVLEGVTVDKISSPIPYTNLVTAEKHIKASDPNNIELQSLRCNERVGGELDILMGIYYSALFPVPVHSLPSGLTIYRLVISSHDPLYTAVIGGPHESFAGMADHFGGFGSHFFTQLQSQLEDFRKFGPPQISRALMSAEDYEFAAKFGEDNLKEKGDLDHLDCSTEKTEDHVVDDLERSVLDVIIDRLDISETVSKISCEDCGVSFNSALISVNDDEDVRDLRMVQKAQEEGLSIEYRCPKCRNCSDCRNSHQTERVSLREEAEDLMIRDSVQLDYKNKRIISHLPMRGRVEEFLSNNRDNAVKILNQQCNKYFNDVETKEVILGAFNKLLKNGQMLLWDDIPKEDRDLMTSKTIQHYIVWRVVFKASLSSPARIVFDASARTRPNQEGLGGRCLNDLVVKGKVTTLNLVKMVLRFCIGPVAVQGDLRQFYASIKLIKDHWNLQRVLFKPDLNPDSPAVEAVISTLIWGVKCVSAQSEKAVDKIATAVKESKGRLAELLRDSRFVDDLGDSDLGKEEILSLVKDADDTFQEVGLSCKGWSISGEDPPTEVCEDGGAVSIGGMKWYTRVDCLEIPIPRLHFSKKSRGRLVVGTEVFDGRTLEDLDKFVPQRLTRRMVVSKKASLFDVLGKLTPINARLSLDLRRVMKETDSWEDIVSPSLRERWVENLFLLEQLRGIKFCRARMPKDAVSAEMELIIAGDTAKEFVKICGVWGRFKLRNGSYSNQHLIGRSLLGDEDSSIPKEELESLAMCSNLGWIVRQMLEKWTKDYIVISDSTIALCWVMSEKKKLSLFHRNRSVQIRRGTDLNKIYHCRSEYNPCDLGTRTDKVSESDVGPHSNWELGLPWMTESVENAVNVGILTPAKDLTMDLEEREEFNQGFVFEKTPEILTRGHVALLSNRAENVGKRLQFSNYIVNPLKHSFKKTVGVISIIIRFIRSFKCVKDKLILNKQTSKFQMFKCNISTGVRDPGIKFHGENHILVSDSDVSKALEYLFVKASAEVKEFNKEDLVKKIAVEKNGILYSKSRILDGQRVQVAAGLEGMEFLSSFKPFRTGFSLVCPVIDRYSPLSFSIAQYIHSEVSNHRGYESSYRASLDFVFIIMGLSLFREIGDDCIRCKKIRSKYLDVSMGPLPEESFVISPPFYICQVDIMGPLHVYVPGHSMALRNRKILEGKCYALVAVCMVTKCVNIQIIESKSADGVIDGINRLSCEVGVPKFVIMDKDTGITKALTECDISLRDLQLHFYKEKGIKFRTVPVSGHNMTGLVERKIKAVQECMERMEVDKMRLHATGYQTLFKLMENDLNNLPFGFGYGRKADNSPLLKLIYPNLLRLGRNNSRSLDSIIKFPKTPGDLMKKVEKAYETFYELWNTVLIPKMMRASKWHSDDELKIVPGDIVYFKKVENELNNKWTVGKVSEVICSSDGKARKAIVVYQNSNEDFNNKRTTERAIRSLVKLFNIDDKLWTSELFGVEKIIEEIDEEENSTVSEGDKDTSGSQEIGSKLKLFVKQKSGGKPCKQCCCPDHCSLVEVHGRSGKKYTPTLRLDVVSSYPGIVDRSWDNVEEFEELLDLDSPADASSLTSLLTMVNVDLAPEPLAESQWSTAD